MTDPATASSVMGSGQPAPPIPSAPVGFLDRARAAQAGQPSQPGQAPPAAAPTIKAGPIPPSARVDPASLFPTGQTPPRGTTEYVRAVMAASLVERGVMTAEQARAELTGAGAPDAAGQGAGGGQGNGTESSTAAPATIDPAGEPETYDALAAMKASTALAGALHEAASEGLPGIGEAEANYYGRALRDALQSPPTEEQKVQWTAETAATLRDAYPGGKADKILADARAEMRILAGRIPQLPYWLEVTGAGSDVGIILRLAKRHAERQGRALAKQAGMR